MKVAVTGAGGFVGQAVRRALRGRGDHVVGLSRRARAPASGEEWIAGELADPAALENLVRGADAVVHAAAWVHRETPDAASRDACFAVNLRGTERLLEVLARRGGRLPFVYIGTTAVYGERFADRDEAGPLEPAGAYGESKLAAERAVLASAAVRGVALRPAMIYGAGAPGNIARLASLVRRGFAPRVGGGRNRKSMVHGDDLADVVLRAIDGIEAAAGRVFNVASEPAPTMTEVGEAFAAGLGRQLMWLPVPGAAWRAGIALGHAWSRGGRRADLGRAMEVYTAEATVRAAAVRERLGARFREVRAGLEASVRQ